MSLIDPGKLPGADLDADSVATHASTLSGLASSVSNGGAATLRAWQALPASYQSDGAEHLYDVMTPVGTASTKVGDGLAAVSRALQAYADTVRPIQADLKALKAEASAFVTTVHNFTPHDVTTNDIWVKISDGPMGFIDPPKTHLDSWDQDQTLVDRNNALIRRGAELAEQWLEAQRTCANAILVAAGHSTSSASGQATPDQIMAQAEAELPWSGTKDIQTPWGSTSSRKESCGEKAMGFPAHFVGGVFTGAFNLVKGVSSLVTGWDGTGVPWEAELAAGWITGRGDIASDAWNRAGKGYEGAWLGMAHLGASLVPGVDSTFLLLGQTPVGNFLGKDTQKNLTDWAHDDQTALGDTIGGLVGLKLPDQWWEAKSWDGFNIAQAWVDDPGGAAGSSAFNIASFFVPGAGEAGAGAHAVEGAADVARAGDVAGDLSHAGGFSSDLAHGVTASDLAKVSDKVSFTDASYGLGDFHVGSLDSSVAKSVDGFDLSQVPSHDAPLTVHELQSQHWSGADAPADVVPQGVHADTPTVAEHATPAERELVSVGSATEHAAVGDHAAAGDHASSPGDVTRSPSSEYGQPGEASPLEGGAAHPDLGSGGSGDHVSAGHSDAGGGTHSSGEGGVRGGSGDGSVPHDGSATPSGDGPAASHDGPGDAASPEAAPSSPAQTPPVAHAEHHLEDGTARHSFANRADLAAMPDSSAALHAAVIDHGMTMPEFEKLAYNTKVDDLTPAQAHDVLEIERSVPAPVHGEVLQKIMTPWQAEKMLDADPAYVAQHGGVDRLGGFVTKAADTRDLVSPQLTHDGLGLGYPGTRYAVTDDSVYAVRFKNTDDYAIHVPDGQLASRAGDTGYVDHATGTVDPVTGIEDPFRGNGFAGSKGMGVKEYVIDNDAAVLSDGDEMFRLNADGSETPVAVFDDATSRWVKIVP